MTTTTVVAILVRLGFVHLIGSVRSVFIVHVRMVGDDLLMVRCFFQFGRSIWFSDYNFEQVENVGGIFLGARAMVSTGNPQHYRASIN